jgi:hypothetical protein
MESKRVVHALLPQISVRMPADTKAAFLTYVEGLGLEVSEVANLLVLREKRLKRLATLSEKGKSPKRARQARGKAVERQHVTVYLRSTESTAEFESYAASCGLKRTDALAWLLEAETKELWLKRVLGSN